LAAVAVVDPHREHFIYNSWHFSAGDRILHDLKLSNYIPFLYHQCPALYERYHEPDVFMTKVAPIDRNGYFNFSISNSAHYAIARKAKKVHSQESQKGYSRGQYPGSSMLGRMQRRHTHF